MKAGPCVRLSVFPCQFRSTLAPYFTLILILSEGQAGEAWEPANKALLLRMWGSIGQKLLSHCSVWRGLNVLSKGRQCRERAIAFWFGVVVVVVVVVDNE